MIIFEQEGRLGFDRLINNEGALLRGESRNASAIAATPCSLYELTRSDLDQLFEKQPSIKEQIISIDEER